MAAEPDEKHPLDQFQEMWGKLASQGGMPSADPMGAMKSLQRVAEAWANNPQDLSNTMCSWTEKLTATNQQIWQDFLSQRPNQVVD